MSYGSGASTSSVHRFTERATPGASADQGSSYSKDAAGITELHYLDSNGAEVQVSLNGMLNPAAIDHGGIVGLADDDHPQYILADGSRALVANWDAGAFEIKTKTVTVDGGADDAILTVETAKVDGIARINLKNDVQHWRLQLTAADAFVLRNETDSTNVVSIDPDSPSNSLVINGQGKVAIGGSPISNVALAIISTTRGFLQPRMTTVQRDAIAGPATGLMVYNTTTNQPEHYDGASWVAEGGVANIANLADCYLNNASSIHGTVGGSGSFTTYLLPTDINAGRLSLYESGAWVDRAFTGSISLINPRNGVGAEDYFVYWSGAAFVLEAVAWTNTTTRATELALQDGVYVKSGDASRRYVGSILLQTGGNERSQGHGSSDAVSGCWSEYNRVQQNHTDRVGGGSGTYTTASWQKLSTVIGFSIGKVQVFVGRLSKGSGLILSGTARFQNTNTDVDVAMAWSDNAGGTTNEAAIEYTAGSETAVVGVYQQISCGASPTLKLGLNVFELLCYSEAVGTTTWANTGGGNPGGNGAMIMAVMER